MATKPKSNSGDPSDGVIPSGIKRREKGRPVSEDKTVNQLGVRLKKEENNQLNRLKKIFRSPTESAVITTILAALKERSDDDIVDFLLRERPISEGFMLPLVGSSPCGEWSQCASHEMARYVDLGMEMASRFGLRRGDFLVETDGSSMRSNYPERDIPSGAWLVMRPNLPSDGEVCLMQARLSNGECVWTIKRHAGSRGNKLEPSRMTDGMGSDFPMPEDVEELTVRGVKIAMITPN